MAAHDTLRDMGKGKKEKERGSAPRLGALLESGDHRAARAEATRLLADPATPDADRTVAAAVLASLRPEPAAVMVGLAGLLTALLIALGILRV
jgi:hypothetical protein